MKFTIGIITDGRNPKALTPVFNSIALNEFYDDMEIIVVGGNETRTVGDYRFIAFDETIKPAWITKKKNMITELAKYDNIVYMHDYISFGTGWAAGFEKFGENFAACMTPIANLDGSRYRDWALWPDDLTDVLGSFNSYYLLPYDAIHLSKYMYFSGAYFVAKKSLMQEFPLDESLSWGQSEDVIWSKQVRQKYDFSLNTNSFVQLLKQKDRVFNDITPAVLSTLNGYDSYRKKLKVV
jgi:hypothetical protein